MGNSPENLSASANRSPSRDLTSDIDAILALSEARTEGIPLSDLEEVMRGRGVGLIVLVLSIPFVFPLPIPLLAAVCCTPMMLLGLRMTLYRKSRLPRSVRSSTLSPEVLRAVAKGLRTLVRPMAWAFRPRLLTMLRGAWWRLIGVSIVLAAFLLALPLPIPLANLIPAVALILLALGLLQRDGLAVLLGHLFTVGSYLYLYFVWEVAVAVFRKLMSWSF